VNLQLEVPVSCRGRVPRAAAGQSDCECIRGCGCGDVERKGRIGRAVPLSICVFEEVPSLDRARGLPGQSIRGRAKRMQNGENGDASELEHCRLCTVSPPPKLDSRSLACHLKSNRFSSVSLAPFPALFFVAILSREAISFIIDDDRPARVPVCSSLASYVS